MKRETHVQTVYIMKTQITLAALKPRHILDMQAQESVCQCCKYQSGTDK